MFIRVSGLLTPAVARQANDVLCARITAGRIDGLALDCRRTRFAHDELQLSHLASRFASHVPPGFPAAFIPARAELGQIVTLTRAIETAGGVARLFSTPNEAIGWALGRTDLMRREHA